MNLTLLGQLVALAAIVTLAVAPVAVLLRAALDKKAGTSPNR